MSFNMKTTTEPLSIIFNLLKWPYIADQQDKARKKDHRSFHILNLQYPPMYQMQLIEPCLLSFFFSSFIFHLFLSLFKIKNKLLSSSNCDTNLLYLIKGELNTYIWLKEYDLTNQNIIKIPSTVMVMGSNSTNTNF